MSTVLLTGFPGFLGSALLPRILERRPEARAVCLVQSAHEEEAAKRAAEIEAEHPGLAGRISLVIGDITGAGLGLDDAARAGLDDVTEVWHLAAVYDLAVAESVARLVNVDGTANVIDFCQSLPALTRLHYVSTCYVSGDHAGEFREDELDLGQGFLNHYEATKFEAEALVRQAMGSGLPATVYRPGIVVGDSTTGATQKYDGPYFLASFIRKQPRLALVPAVGPADEVRVGMVPRDYVINAMAELSVRPESQGQTYALTDPNPPTGREVVDVFAHGLGRRVIWVPLPLGLTRTVIETVPGLEWLLGLPAEVLDYFASRTTHSTTNAQRDLDGSGVVCPPFAEYGPRLLEFMVAHPEIDAAPMT